MTSASLNPSGPHSGGRPYFTGGSMPSHTEGFEEASRRFWERRTGRPCSREDAREMAENMVGFIRILRGWEVAGRKDNSRGTSEPQTDAGGEVGKEVE